jgi:hypothetical protein
LSPSLSLFDTGFVGNVGSAGETEFDSMYESFNPLTTVNKQHFVEWFSGSALDSIWTQTNIVGTGGFVMEDSVDGGFKLSCGTNVNDHSEIDFNNKRQYAHNGSVFITVTKKGATGGSDLATYYGFVSNITSGATNEAGISDSSFGNASLSTADASTRSLTGGTVNTGTAWHTHKIETSASNVVWYVDGVLNVTKTTNRPTITMQPHARILNTSTSGIDDMWIRYMECYNT